MEEKHRLDVLQMKREQNEKVAKVQEKLKMMKEVQVKWRKDHEEAFKALVQHNAQTFKTFSTKFLGSEDKCKNQAIEITKLEGEKSKLTEQLFIKTQESHDRKKENEFKDK